MGREDPWRRAWQPTPVFVPGKCHGLGSLVGYSPWGRKGWTRLTEHTHLAHVSALRPDAPFLSQYFTGHLVVVSP